MTAAMRQLGEGRFDVILPGGRKNQLGGMAEAVELFKLKDRERATVELEAKTEQDRTAAAQRKANIARLAGNSRATVGLSTPSRRHRPSLRAPSAV
ncbi:hypothetical protein [Bradyrhizobium australiense]|uniref:Uncharacterized protein n=1 Tax=Bradyrhizobium australiense TaxID=2721161 RepID=A0A7Y4GYV8_9BRAD|nr:hypothetical protein [Bradyrhizobium australiense]NOJ44541.1 hypothetical protein [Bradyrhizobium australiense]